MNNNYVLLAGVTLFCVIVSTLITDQILHYFDYQSKHIFYFISFVEPLLATPPSIYAYTILNTKIKKDQKELENKNAELQEILDESRKLGEMIRICPECKNIKDSKGFWTRIESYIESHSKAYFSHSICPECQVKMEEEAKG